MGTAEHHYQRGCLLYEQANYRLAEKEFAFALNEDPYCSEARGLLAICLSQRKKSVEACVQIRQGLALDPTSAYLYYVQAHLILQRGNSEETDDALASINEALRLNASVAEYHALQSSVFITLCNWPKALAAAEVGLSLDARNLSCLNWRAVALLGLGRMDEARDVIGTALGEAPEDAVTLARKGWMELARGEVGNAHATFESALRISPDLAWAREGLVVSLKSRNEIYRIIHRMGLVRFVRFLAYLCLVVLLVLLYFTRTEASRVWWFSEWLLRVSCCYLVLELTVSYLEPVCNSILRLNRDARLTLSDGEVSQCNLIAVCAGASGLLLMAWFGWPSWKLHYFALLCLLQGIPVAVTGEQFAYASKRFMKGYLFLSLLSGVVGALVVLCCPADLNLLPPSLHDAVVWSMLVSVMVPGLTHLVSTGVLPGMEKRLTEQCVRETENSVS